MNLPEAVTAAAGSVQELTSDSTGVGKPASRFADVGLGLDSLTDAGQRDGEGTEEREPN